MKEDEGGRKRREREEGGEREREGMHIHLPPFSQNSLSCP